MAVNTEPAWYQKWLKKNGQDIAKPVLTTNPQQNNITFYCGDELMLTVAEDGFYVRGIKVKADDKEAAEVYNCFKQWLNWNMLNNRN
jgi:hypothetical protein